MLIKYLMNSNFIEVYKLEFSSKRLEKHVGLFWSCSQSSLALVGVG